MDATFDPLTPITAGVNGRSGALRDAVDRPPGAAFGEIFTAQDAARVPSSAASEPAQADATSGIIRHADGKNLPGVAATVADIAADVVARQSVPVDAVSKLPDAAPEEALTGAVGQPVAPVVLPVAASVVTPLAAAEQATGPISEAPLPATVPALDALPTLSQQIPSQQIQAQSTLSGVAPAPGADVVASVSPRAAVSASAMAIDGPSAAAVTPGAQVESASDALLLDDQSRLMQPLAGAVRAAFNTSDTAAVRQAPNASDATMVARGAQPAAAPFGPADQIVLPVDTQLAQGEASRLPTELLEEFAAEQLLNRGAAQAASSQVAQAAQPGSFAALLPLADSDAALLAKTGVHPPLLAVPGDAAFDTELAGRVSLLVRDGLSEARLQLNPPELGRLDIKISTDGDQTRVSFLVQGAETREVIEQAMPRLRELLEQSGLQLSRFDVSDHSRSQHQGEGGASGGYAADTTAAGEGEPAGPGTALRVSPGSQSLVDFYV